MKRAGLIVGAAALAAAVGCATTPTADTCRLIGRAGGTATALVLNQCDIDQESYRVITNVVAGIGGCVPAEGETLQEAWIRTAQEHTDILVARGDLTPQQGAMVMAGFRLVVQGYDLLLVYYPEVAVYAELTTAAVDGFSEGFLASARPDPAAAKSVASGLPDCRVLRGLEESEAFGMLKR